MLVVRQRSAQRAGVGLPVVQPNSPLTKSLLGNQPTTLCRPSQLWPRHMVGRRPTQDFVNGLLSPLEKLRLLQTMLEHCLQEAQIEPLVWRGQGSAKSTAGGGAQRP
jgi:hypothetical protein